jgi:four helix bundle protein
MTVWKKSIQMVEVVYSLTSQFPKTEQIGLTSQLRRSAISIPSNIAEGASRSSQKERSRFYEISRSSLVELDTQLEISLNLRIISKSQIEELDKLINEIFALLTAMK